MFFGVAALTVYSFAAMINTLRKTSMNKKELKQSHRVFLIQWSLHHYRWNYLSFKDPQLCPMLSLFRFFCGPFNPGISTHWECKHLHQCSLLVSQSAKIPLLSTTPKVCCLHYNVNLSFTNCALSFLHKLQPCFLVPSSGCSLWPLHTFKTYSGILLGLW